MPSPQPATSSPPRQPALSLVESPWPGDVEIGPPAATRDDRVAIAALQTYAAELQMLAATTHAAAGALLDSSEPAAEAIVDAALRSIPRWHFAMLNDRSRNELFEVALQRRMRPGCSVLDIGSGTGLLAMMAVRAGAGHVTTCEVNPLLAELSRQVIAEHGMSEQITVVAKRSTDLVIGDDLAAPVDMLISEIVDCGLIGEGLLPTVSHAREHLLAPDGAMLPVRARLIGCIVESTAIASLNAVAEAGGYDVRLLNRFSTPGHFPVRLETWPHALLSEPVQLLELDLERDSLDDGAIRVELDPRDHGSAHGLVAWFELDLGADVVVCNAPSVAGSHWMQAFIPWTSRLDVTPGEPVAIDLAWRKQRLTATPATGR
jgi:SAM-dependent methyltransferase